MPPTLQKPARWLWTPALLSPEGRSLARGLQVLIPLWEDGTATDVVAAEIAAGDGQTNVVTPYGMGRRSAVEGTTVPAYWTSDDRWKWRPTDDGITVVVFVDKEADASLSAMMAHRLTSWVAGIWYFGSASGNLEFGYFAAGGAETETNGNGAAANTSPIFGDYNLYAYSSPPAATGQLYRNGVKLVMATTYTNAPDVGDLRGNFGGIQNTGDYTAQGNYLLGAKWNRALSDDEHALLAADPFILLRRDTSFVTVLAAPSGINYTRTVTDTVGVTDATSRVAPAVRTATDPVNITDATSAAKSSQATATEPVTVTDSVSVVLIRTASITDPVNVTDAITAAKTISTTITEPVSTTDAVSTAKTISETITEPVSITDATAFSKSGDKTETITEAISVTDSVSRVAPAVRSITEAASVTDATSTAKTILVTVTEAVSIIDATSAPKLSSITIIEPVSTTDLISRTRSMFRVINEPILVTDSPSRIATAVRTITDPVAVTDSTTKVLSVVGLVTCIGFKRHPDPSLARNPDNAGTRTPPPGGCSSP